MVNLTKTFLTSIFVIGGTTVYGWEYPGFNTEYEQIYGNLGNNHGSNSYGGTKGQQSNFAQYSYGGQGSKADAYGYSKGYNDGVTSGYGNIYKHHNGYQNFPWGGYW